MGSVVNNNWYNLNSTRQYPLDDGVTGVDDNGVNMSDTIITDINLRLPKSLGSLVMVSGVNVTKTLVTVTLVAVKHPANYSDTDQPVAVETYSPVCAVTVKKPLQIGKPYSVNPLSEGVGGWIVFGEGTNTEYSGRFSSSSQSSLNPKTSRFYSNFPVTSLSKVNSSILFKGLIELKEGTNVSITKQTKLIDGIERQAIVVALKEDPNTNVFDKYRGSCSGRPESNTCNKEGIQFINSAVPDCAGNINIIFEEPFETAKYVDEDENEIGGIAVDYPLGLIDTCAATNRLPDDAGDFGGSKDPQCELVRHYYPLLPGRPFGHIGEYGRVSYHGCDCPPGADCCCPGGPSYYEKAIAPKKEIKLETYVHTYTDCGDVPFLQFCSNVPCDPNPIPHDFNLPVSNWFFYFKVSLPSGTLLEIYKKVRIYFKVYRVLFDSLKERLIFTSKKVKLEYGKSTEINQKFGGTAFKSNSTFKVELYAINDHSTSLSVRLSTHNDCPAIADMTKPCDPAGQMSIEWEPKPTTTPTPAALLDESVSVITLDCQDLPVTLYFNNDTADKWYIDSGEFNTVKPPEIDSGFLSMETVYRALSTTYFNSALWHDCGYTSSSNLLISSEILIPEEGSNAGIVLNSKFNLETKNNEFIFVELDQENGKVNISKISGESAYPISSSSEIKIEKNKWYRLSVSVKPGEDSESAKINVALEDTSSAERLMTVTTQTSLYGKAVGVSGVGSDKSPALFSYFHIEKA